MVSLDELPDLWKRYLIQCGFDDSKMDLRSLERGDVAPLIIAETTRFAMYDLWFCTNDAGNIWRPEIEDFDFVKHELLFGRI